MIGSEVYYPRLFTQGIRNRLRLIFIDHIERSGHNPMFEEPAEFDSHLLNWIRETPSEI